MAAKRQWVLSVTELHELGWTKRRIEGAVATAFLYRVHRGVYAVGRSELSFEGRCRAAWLASGQSSAVSHGPAAAVWGWRKPYGRIHVSVPRGRRGHPGLVVHRPRSLAPEDVVMRRGFAVTSVARTLLDLSPDRSPETVGGWMHEAGVQGVLDVRAIHAVLQRERHHRGGRVLEAALAVEVLPTRTGLEKLGLAAWRRAGLLDPVVNGHVWTGEKLEEVDLHHRALGLVVEVDGGRYHASRWRRRRDAAKDARLRAMGWTVLRVPELRLTLEPAGVVADIRAAAAVGRPKAPPRGIM